MDIKSLLYERSNYLLMPQTQDEWLLNILGSQDEEVAIITTEAILLKNRKSNSEFANFLEKHHLKAIFDLKNPFYNISCPFFLYIFSKTTCEKVAYGIYYHEIKQRFSETVAHQFQLIENLSAEYREYLSGIDRYLSCGDLAEDSTYYEFGVFPSSAFDFHNWNPLRYSKKTPAQYEEIAENNAYCLGNIAEIITIRQIPDADSVLTITPSSWKYPFDYKKASIGKATNSPLCKGDIIVFNSNGIYLMYEEPQTELHTSSMFYIIRVTSDEFCPEYVYYYLKSEKGKMLLRSIESTAFPRIRSARELSEIPILAQEKEHLHYRRMFFEENFPYSYLKEHPIEAPKGYVFISYSTKNQVQADEVKQILTDSAIDCWMAPQSIPAGSNYGAEIPSAIEKCQALVLLLSQESQESMWVSKEVKLALNKNKIVIPFQIDNLILNSEFDFLLIDCQRVVAHNRESEAVKELIGRINKLT